jgi:energy-coupling factor transporter ATP-binding protein EcfA2
MITIQAKEFGPIQNAKITLKPLTIFVGPNISGKSYIAQLIYALSQVKSHISEPAHPFSQMYAEIFETIIGKPSFSNDTLTTLAERIQPDIQQFITKPMSNRAFRILFDSLPIEIKNNINTYLEYVLDGFNKELTTQLERCYDTKISRLVRKSGDNKTFLIELISEHPELDFLFESRGNSLTMTKKLFSLDNQMVEAYAPRSFAMQHRLERMNSKRESLKDSLLYRIAVSFVVNSDRTILKNLPDRCFYFPAARSGILYGQKALARVGLKTMQRAGIEKIEIPRLPGAIIDFLDAVFSIDKNETGDFSSLARQLEKKLMPGRIEFVDTGKGLPEIFFMEPSVGRLALHRASSMISELAPIILLLRYSIKKGDTVIIEEPESHMHPGAQCEIARFLVSLARNGANVIITTHSDYMYQQISNLVAFGTKLEKQNSLLPQSATNVISSEDVAAYLFRRTSKGGATVKELHVGLKGLDDGEFGPVAEALFQEAIEAKS